MEVDPKETGKRADSDTTDSCPLEATEIAAADPSEKASQGAPPLAVAATPNGSHTVGGLGVPEQSEEEYDDEDDDDFEDEEGDFDSQDDEGDDYYDSEDEEGDDESEEEEEEEEEEAKQSLKKYTKEQLLALKDVSPFPLPFLPLSPFVPRCALCVTDRERGRGSHL